MNAPLGVILKTTPSPLEPPIDVVPYKSPLVPWTSPASGRAPSVPSKLCSVVSVPVGLILKTVPLPLAPPEYVVP